MEKNNRERHAISLPLDTFTSDMSTLLSSRARCRLTKRKQSLEPAVLKLFSPGSPILRKNTLSHNDVRESRFFSKARPACFFLIHLPRSTTLTGGYGATPNLVVARSRRDAPRMVRKERKTQWINETAKRSVNQENERQTTRPGKSFAASKKNTQQPGRVADFFVHCDSRCPFFLCYSVCGSERSGFRSPALGTKRK